MTKVNSQTFLVCRNKFCTELLLFLLSPFCKMGMIVFILNFIAGRIGEWSDALKLLRNFFRGGEN